MLRAWAGAPATIAAIDPTPLIEGAANEYPDLGLADAGGDAGVAPGSLGACKVLGAVPLSPALPASSTPGPTWPDGVPYVDGGVVLADAEPSLGPTCSSGTAVDAGATPLPALFGTLDQPHPTAMAMRTDVPVLYVADGALPGSHLLPSVRGELLARLGRHDEARAELARAVDLCGSEPERTLLRRKIAGIADRA